MSDKERSKVFRDAAEAALCEGHTPSQGIKWAQELGLASEMEPIEQDHEDGINYMDTISTEIPSRGAALQEGAYEDRAASEEGSEDFPSVPTQPAAPPVTPRSKWQDQGIKTGSSALRSARSAGGLTHQDLSDRAHLMFDQLDKASVPIPASMPKGLDREAKLKERAKRFKAKKRATQSSGWGSTRPSAGQTSHGQLTLMQRLRPVSPSPVPAAGPDAVDENEDDCGIRIRDDHLLPLVHPGRARYGAADFMLRLGMEGEAELLVAGSKSNGLKRFSTAPSRVGMRRMESVGPFNLKRDRADKTAREMYGERSKMAVSQRELASLTYLNSN